MKQPEFKFWPWGVLALIVPIVALVAAVFFRQTRQAAELEVLCVFLSLLGAGNAYVLAIATGSFARTIIAIPVGAAAGYLAPLMLASPWVMGVYLLLVMAALIGLTEEAFGLGIVMLLVGSIFCFLLMSGLVFVFAWACASVFVERDRFVHAVGAFLCYPFIWACIAASMPEKRSIGGVVTPILSGLQAGICGLMAGILATFMSVFLSRDPIGIGIVIGLVALAANYAAFTRLFSAARRVTEEKAKQAPPNKPPPDVKANTP